VFGWRWQREKQVARLSPDLHGYATALIGDADLSFDLAQETLTKLLVTPHAPREFDDLKPYSFRMLRNLYVDYLRKQKIRLEYSAEQERLLSETHTRSFDASDQLAVREAFKMLKESHREILFLIDVMGMKYLEVAEVMDIPKGTVMSRISRARAEMMKNLQDDPLDVGKQNRIDDAK
jgi:RNA polymerase sigma-70 factor (ECF subfamily)